MKVFGVHLARLVGVGVIFMAVMPLLSACFLGPKSPRPPLVIPYSPERFGSRLETDIRIVKDGTFVFLLRFHYVQDDVADTFRVGKLADLAASELHPVPIISIPLRIKIFLVSADGLTLIEERGNDAAWVSQGPGYYGVHMASVGLKRGKYRVIIESLKSIPELNGTRMSVEIANSWIK